MPFVSQLIERPVADIDGESIGKLIDLIAIPLPAMTHPKITAIQVKTQKGEMLVPVGGVAALFAPTIPLNVRQGEIPVYTPEENDLYLIRDVLDKQIIDINGARVVRVNDLELSRVGQDIYVANVDISGSGLLRRMGLGKFVPQKNKKPEDASNAGKISWDDVELLGVDQPMRLKVPGNKLSELHPADLAEIVSDLTRQDSSKFLESLDLKVLADTLEEVEPEFQASLVENMPDDRVADVLEEMSPDEAADLLAELPEDRSQDLLKLMQEDEAKEVRKLLTYPVESAGGIMNTEFATVRPDMTANEVMNYLRATAEEEVETIYYIYVLDVMGVLVGVFSLRTLVLVPPKTKVSEFMEDRVITVEVKDSQDKIAYLVSKYNLLAIPVVDEQKHMHGIVTADDALDKIIPTAWKKRLPRLYR